MAAGDWPLGGTFGRDHVEQFSVEVFTVFPEGLEFTAHQIAAEGDWVAWIGTYEDLKEGNEGAYRVRFKDNKKGWDTTYPAAELLPDGSLVCTTYGHWKKGESPYILSFKFHIKTLDEKAKKIKKFGQTTIHNEMGENIFIFDPDNPKMIQKKIED